jgi:hypothetical protein
MRCGPPTANAEGLAGFSVKVWLAAMILNTRNLSSPLCSYFDEPTSGWW